MEDAQLDVTTLYKFRPYSTPTDEARLEEIVIKNKVFVPAPSSFNDPFDPRPRYVPREREKFVYHYSKIARQDFGADSQLERRILKADPAAITASLTEKYQKLYREESGVLSLTGTREPILLWSHYAANHAGICIHFSRRVAPFNWSMPVRYTDSYPEIPIPFDQDYQEQYITTLCTKASIWSYEREFRLARMPLSFDTGVDIWDRWDGRHMIIPPEAITGITIGASMSDVNRAKILTLGRQRVPAIEVWQAHLHESKYVLIFQRVN